MTDSNVPKTSKPQSQLQLSHPPDSFNGDEAERRGFTIVVMTPNNEPARSGTGKHRHGVATKALKVFLGTAAVAGSIWGVTSAAKAKGSARNNAAALLMKSKATKAPTVMTKAPKEPKGGKEEECQWLLNQKYCLDVRPDASFIFTACPNASAVGTEVGASFVLDTRTSTLTMYEFISSTEFTQFFSPNLAYYTLQPGGTSFTITQQGLPTALFSTTSCQG